ncbi:MAG TPA: LamG-like jellyroll fold domain-containing protein [Verrucomicrobiae bacterium]|nr:LamG-like jellyroll fold domain-containing protein [Verrucomicrobiae bacterium]
MGWLPGIAVFWANHAQALTFTWAPDSTPGIAGYRLYYGSASRSYPNTIDVGNSTTAAVNGLLTGTTYYFAVTAYTTAAVESDFSSEIAYTVPVSTNGAPTQGLVCYWKFDEGSGAVATDSSGIGNTGKLINSPTWSSGRVGGALSFNGQNNAVSTPAINLSGTRAVSVALWVNRTYSKTGGHSLVESSTGISGSTTGFMLFPDDSSTCAGGGMLVGLQGNAGYNLKCYAQPSSGIWHHLVVIFDKSQAAANEIQLYLDGILQSAQAQPASSDNTNYFGNNPLYLMSRAGSGDFASGVIDDFRIYNRALSASEIQQLYGATKPTVTLTSPGNGAVVSGSVTAAATATSTIGVQIKVDGTNLGAEMSSTPYQIAWNTLTASNGSHLISAVARDASGNTATSTATVIVSNVPLQGLVCYWKLDEGSGATATDSSGAGNTGKLINSPLWTAGKMNGALSFNGVNNALSTPGVNLSGTRSVTVALWVNRTYGGGGNHALFESTTGFSASTTGFMMFPDDTSSCVGGGILVGLRGDAGNNLKCFAQPSNGVWHHLVAVFDKSQSALNEVNLYVDGVQQTARAQSASSDNTNNFGNNPFYLMSRSGSGDFCAGLIDDVRIYSRALSAGEIQQIYSLGTVLNKQAMQIKAISSGARYSPVLAPGIITGQYIQDGLFSFSVTGDTGRGYGVEASPDALHWTQIDIVVPMDGVATFKQPLQSDHQFYRIRPLP